MDKTDRTLPEQMNLGTDALIGNQCGRDGQETSEHHGHTVRWLLSSRRGVGQNRNDLLEAAKGDICVLADDDVVYADGVFDRVREAFETNPKADVIIFGMDLTKDGQTIRCVRPKVGRLRRWNCLRYGTYCVAIRRERVMQKGIRFSEWFGGGCLYGAGEDSLFFLDCLRWGLRIYGSSVVLGTCAKDKSSWFKGYNQKYYYDKGAWLACAFPHTKHLLKWYYIGQGRRRCPDGGAYVRREINRGIKGFANKEPYFES
jgi:glycosyltransferase involved in cell wall biosynthesis